MFKFKLWHILHVGECWICNPDVGPWFKSSSLLLDVLVFGGPRFNSSKPVGSSLTKLSAYNIKLFWDLKLLRQEHMIELYN